MKGHAKDITCAACSFSLKLVATSGADGHILVWNYGLGLLEGLCKSLQVVTKKVAIPTALPSARL